MKTLNTSKRVTLRELYLGYPYKYRDITSSTVPIPYFPKEEITEHKYSLTFKEWKRIIKIYLKHVVIYLLTGFKYKLSSRLGFLQMRKAKSKKIPDWGKTRKRYGTTKGVKPLYHKNIHTQGYRPIIKWYREGQNAKFKYKWYWRFNFLDKQWKWISDQIFNNLTIMNKFQRV